MKALTDLLHPFTGRIWEEWIERINTPINKYLDDDDAVSNVVNVWTSVGHVIDEIKFRHIRNDLREGV